MSTAPGSAPTRTDPGSGSARMSRAAIITTALLFLTWLIDYFDRLIMNIALPDIGKAFGLNHAQEGLVVSAFFVAYALSQLPGGLIADRFGTRRIIAAAMIIWSVFTGLTALAWSFGAMLVIRILFGVGEGMFPAASFKAITERTTPRERMYANGWMLSSNNFGGAVAPLVAAPLIAAVGWRWGFGVSAFAGIVVLILVLLFLPPRQETAPGQPPESAAQSAGQPAAQPAARSAAGAVGPDPQAGKQRSWAVLRCPVIYVYVAMFFGLDLIGWGINTWMPSYLLSARGLSLKDSAGLLAIGPVVAGVATIAGGKLSDKLGGRPRLVVAPAMVVSAVALILMANSVSLTAFVFWECVALLGFGLSFMPVMAVPLKTLNGRFTGSAAGVINFGGQLAGVLAPVIMGALIDASGGYTAAFLFLVGGAVVCLIGALLAPQTPPRLKTRMQRSPGLEGGFVEELEPAR